MNARVLSKQLKNLGCVVHVANHGGEALDILRKSTYWNHEADTEHATAASERIGLSVVLMDQEMPIMDGLTCTRKIREFEREGKFVRHVPVIAVTANARNEQIETAMSAGMVSRTRNRSSTLSLLIIFAGRCHGEAFPHSRADPQDRRAHGQIS